MNNLLGQAGIFAAMIAVIVLLVYVIAFHTKIIAYVILGLGIAFLFVLLWSAAGRMYKDIQEYRRKNR